MTTCWRVLSTKFCLRESRLRKPSDLILKVRCFRWCIACHSARAVPTSSHTHVWQKRVCGSMVKQLHWIYVIDLDFDLSVTPIMFEINVFIQILSFPYGLLLFYNGIKYFVSCNFQPARFGVGDKKLKIFTGTPVRIQWGVLEAILCLQNKILQSNAFMRFLWCTDRFNIIKGNHSNYFRPYFTT